MHMLYMRGTDEMTVGYARNQLSTGPPKILDDRNFSCDRCLSGVDQTGAGKDVTKSFHV